MDNLTLLPPALVEFVVVADTHYMLDPGDQAVEFESRRRQTARAGYALQQIAALKPQFVIHMGDLVQEFPETPRFVQAVTEALQQLKDCGIAPYQVAGNHDVGDKPDPTMPTDWVTAESLQNYHERFGQSWYSWTVDNCHFVVLNSQILNSALPEAGQQRQWLEADLQTNRERRTFLFCHLAPFLCYPDEPGLGHYDNIASPARDWLLGLIRQYPIELVFSAHSHFAFFNRIGKTRHFGAASTSFTRPGFSELFSSGPPSEQGRNDIAKLGFYLIRVLETETSVHFIRTSGKVSSVGPEGDVSRLITNNTADLSGSPLGVNLIHPLTYTTDVPLSWPSTVRQPVRNDYPFLSCIEAGVQHLRLPGSDLADPVQRERLAFLRDEACRVTATWLTANIATMVEEARQYRAHIDTIEYQISGTPLPDTERLRQIQQCQTELEIPVSLNTIIPREKVPGKQHLRTRFGYKLNELAELNQRLASAGVTLDRVLCHLDATDSPGAILRGAESVQSAVGQITHIDWLLTFTSLNEQEQMNQAAEALFCLAPMSESRLFLSPLLDLDRTMDVTFGLLDRACNPRPVFQVMRCLNTILYSAPKQWTPVEAPSVSGFSSFAMKTEAKLLWLLLPLSVSGERAAIDDAALEQMSAGYRNRQVFDLVQGTVRSLDSSESIQTDAPILIQFF